MSAPASSAAAYSNVRLITILAASLLAGYAGDEAYNAWWRPSAGKSTETAAHLVEPVPEGEIAKVALASRPWSLAAREEATWGGTRRGRESIAGTIFNYGLPSPQLTPDPLAWRPACPATSGPGS